MDRNVVLTSFQELSPLMETCIAEGSEVVLTVTGNSMRPLFRHRRDQVVLTRYDHTGLKRGDVPLYRRENGQFVLHRVIGADDDGYVLCGDGQWKQEYGITDDMVVALMSGFYHRGKRYAISNFLYRIYAGVWMAILPLRPFVFRTGSFAKRCVCKLYRIFRKKA